jgi:hypothetical protein
LLGRKQRAAIFGAVAKTVGEVVTNPAALRILEAAYKLARLPMRTGIESALNADASETYDTIYVGPTMHQQRTLIRHQLKNSGLNLLLPGGLEALPDIFEAAPPWMRPILRWRSPITFEDLIRFVAANLRWYLEPSKGKLSIVQTQGCQLLFVASVVVLTFLVTILATTMVPLWAGLSLWGLIFYAFGLFISALQARSLRGYDPEVAALELYLYLRDSYQEPTPTEPEASLTDASLVESLKNADLQTNRNEQTVRSLAEGAGPKP